MPSELQNYIVEARKQGFSNDQIIEKLKSVGWEKNLIDQAIGTELEPPKPQNLPHSKKLMLASGVLVLLMIAGILVYLQYYKNNKITSADRENSLDTESTASVEGFTNTYVHPTQKFSFMYPDGVTIEDYSNVGNSDSIDLKKFQQNAGYLTTINSSINLTLMTFVQIEAARGGGIPDIDCHRYNFINCFVEEMNKKIDTRSASLLNLGGKEVALGKILTQTSSTEKSEYFMYLFVVNDSNELVVISVLPKTGDTMIDKETIELVEGIITTFNVNTISIDPTIAEPQAQALPRTSFTSSPLPDGVSYSLEIPKECLVQQGPTIAVQVAYPPDDRTIVCNLNGSSFTLIPQSGGSGATEILSTENLTLGQFTWEKKKWIAGNISGISYYSQNENVLLIAQYSSISPDAETMLDRIIASFQLE